MAERALLLRPRQESTELGRAGTLGFLTPLLPAASDPHSVPVKHKGAAGLNTKLTDVPSVHPGKVVMSPKRTLNWSPVDTAMLALFTVNCQA